MISPQRAWADDPNTSVFRETFDKNTTFQGGRDGNFNGGSGQKIAFDNEGWTGNNTSKIYGANQCLRFGTDKDNGVLTTPEISLGGASYALLTFSATGWGDASKNTLSISVNDGFTIVSGDNNIAELENAVWNDYSVLQSRPRPY